MGAIDRVDINIGEAAVVLSERGPQISGRERNVDTDGQSARLAARHSFEPSEGGIGLFDDTTSRFQKLSADLSWVSSTVGALEQLCSETIFEIAKPTAQRRLPNIQRFRSAPQATVARCEGMPI
jgi:hypothetical protein